MCVCTSCLYAVYVICVCILCIDSMYAFLVCIPYMYSQISKIANSNLRLGSLADRSFGANAGWFGKRFHKILDPRIDVILGVGEIVAHVRSFAGRGTLVDRSIFAYLYE